MRIYEHRGETPLTRVEFARRMLHHGAFAFSLVIGSLVIGMVGYHGLGKLPWVDAFLNSAMLLGGMGPVGELQTTSAKIFAGLYALYAGMVFLVLAATLAVPLFHRVLHRFHWEIEQGDQAKTKKP